MTTCRLCGRDVRVAGTADGRQVVLDAAGVTGHFDGPRFLLDEDEATRAIPVAAEHSGFAYRRHRDTCRYGFVG